MAQGHSAIVILLVRDHRASTKVFDEDGDTPLHLILSKTQQSDESCLTLLSTDLIPQMPVDYRHIPNIVLAAFLIKSDAPLLVKNRLNKLPLDYVSDQKLKEYLILLNRSTIIRQVMPNSCALSPCIICDECPADVLFEPCKHKISCQECCVKMKRCVLCQLTIECKYSSGSLSTRGPSLFSLDETTIRSFVFRRTNLEQRVDDQSNAPFTTIAVDHWKLVGLDTDQQSDQFNVEQRRRDDQQSRSRAREQSSRTGRRTNVFDLYGTIA